MRLRLIKEFQTPVLATLQQQPYVHSPVDTHLSHRLNHTSSSCIDNKPRFTGACRLRDATRPPILNPP